MKKIIVFVSMILLGSALYAGPVTPEKALQVAQKVFASATATKAVDASTLQIVWDGEFEHTKNAQDPAFYVISRPEGGFVMVAGNDNVQPVLGFSFENEFKVEGMPENVRWWMEQYKHHVRSAVTQTPKAFDQWAQFEETKASAVPVTSGLTNEFKGSRTNLWNQLNPANYYCPDVPGQTKTSVCGCVALATAEVMAWFGTANIASASGTVPAYSYTPQNGGSFEVVAHVLGTVYDWENIHNLAKTDPYEFYDQQPGWSTSDDLQKGVNKGTTLTPLGVNVAHLVYDIGTILKAKYNDGANTGTGAMTRDIISAVGPIMHYNNGARFVSKDGYTNGEWSNLIKSEVYLHPVIYDGHGATGGHCYVVDGYGTYSDNLMFHFNMGWGGSDNGYYTLDIQDDLDSEHGAILDFYPNPSSYEALPFLTYREDGSGIQDVTGYNTGTLDFNVYYFDNQGGADFTGCLYAARKNAVESISEYIPISSELTVARVPTGASSWSLGGYGGFSATVSSPVLGEHLEVYYKETGKDTYHPFLYDPQEAGLISAPVFPAAAIKKNASYSVGDYFVFEITNNSYLPEKTDVWSVTTPSGTTTNYTLDDYRVQLTGAGEYKITCTTSEETLVTYITVITVE